MAYGADPEIGDKDGFTPLMMAASTMGTDSLRILLENNANANVKNYSGATPLMAAIIYGHYESARILLESGKVENIYEPCLRNQTVFEYAVVEDNVDCLKLLLEYSHPGKLMKHLLMLVLSNRNIEALRVLLEHVEDKEILYPVLEAYLCHEFREGVSEVLLFVGYGYVEENQKLITMMMQIEIKEGVELANRVNGNLQLFFLKAIYLADRKMFYLKVENIAMSAWMK